MLQGGDKAGDFLLEVAQAGGEALVVGAGEQVLEGFGRLRGRFGAEGGQGAAEAVRAPRQLIQVGSSQGGAQPGELAVAVLEEGRDQDVGHFGVDAADSRHIIE